MNPKFLVMLRIKLALHKKNNAISRKYTVAQLQNVNNAHLVVPYVPLKDTKGFFAQLAILVIN